MNTAAYSACHLDTIPPISMCTLLRQHPLRIPNYSQKYKKNGHASGSWEGRDSKRGGSPLVTRESLGRFSVERSGLSMSDAAGDLFALGIFRRPVEELVQDPRDDPSDGKCSERNDKYFE